MHRQPDSSQRDPAVGVCGEGAGGDGRGAWTMRADGAPAPRGRRRSVAVLLDTPRWPAHGTLWAHLVSDTSLAELHAFAARCGVPRRSFDLDHYDVPAARHAELVAAGAQHVEGRELV